VIEQLAGDLLPNATREQRIATGFHRNKQINKFDPISQRKYFELFAFFNNQDEPNLEDYLRKLKFFVGLTSEEIATLLGVNEKTVRRHWSFAKAWLFQKMSRNT
jgi:hypothetical protein